MLINEFIIVTPETNLLQIYKTDIMFKMYEKVYK